MISSIYHKYNLEFSIIIIRFFLLGNNGFGRGVRETLILWFLPWQQLKDGEQRRATGCSVRREESAQGKKQKNRHEKSW